MRISSVVMNASPLICMIKAGIIEILPALFEDIVVPEAVRREILVKEHTPPKGESLDPYQWMRLVNDIPIDPRAASWDLGQGEGQVISFALHHPHHWALLDDREARRCAAALNCRHTGTLGIIVLAKRRRIIDSISYFSSCSSRSVIKSSRAFMKASVSTFSIGAEKPFRISFTPAPNLSTIFVSNPSDSNCCLGACNLDVDG
jgi:predicted nucleic acid-binding protein